MGHIGSKHLRSGRCCKRIRRAHTSRPLQSFHIVSPVLLGRYPLQDEEHLKKNATTAAALIIYYKLKPMLIKKTVCLFLLYLLG